MSSLPPLNPYCGFPGCKVAAPLRCGRCLEVHYCGEDHQGLHWKLHKKLCRPPEAKVKAPVPTQPAKVAPPAEEDDESCVICCDKVINAKFVPCGHSATCSDCADLLIARGEPCCFCRKPLNKYEVGKWEGVTGDVGLWPKSEENLRNLASGEGFSDYFRNMFNGNEEAYLR